MGVCGWEGIWLEAPFWVRLPTKEKNERRFKKGEKSLRTTDGTDAGGEE
jgi:hypothetical protein